MKLYPTFLMCLSLAALSNQAIAAEAPVVLKVAETNCDHSSFSSAHSNCVEVQFNSATFDIEVNENFLLSFHGKPVFFVSFSRYRSNQARAFPCGVEPISSCSGKIENTAETIVAQRFVNMDQIRTLELAEEIKKISASERAKAETPPTSLKSSPSGSYISRIVDDIRVYIWLSLVQF